MVKVAITIDTEEDLWGEYLPAPSPVKNIEAIPLVQDLFDAYGAAPTYLVNYPVVIDDDASRLLQSILEKGRCELGVHCHPWNTPPYEGERGESTTMLCNLEDRTVRNKMENLHEAFVSRFGMMPLSFRAGRWAFGPVVAKSIESLGFKVDSSVTPLVNWSACGGPDFFDAPRYPYRLSAESVLAAQKESCLLEAPPTTGFFQRNPELCSTVLRHILRGKFIKKLKIIGMLDYGGIINLRWLSPELSSGRDMALLAQRLVDNGATFLNMSFHSSSLLPGKSPFVRDENDLKGFLSRIRRFLELANDAGWKFVRLKDIIRDY